MATFDALQDNVRDAQQTRQRLVLPINIVGNTTAGLVNPSAYDPSILTLKTGAVDQTAVVTTAAGATPPTFTPVDSTGSFGALITIGEYVSLVVNAQLVNLTANTVCYANITATPTGGIVTGTTGVDGYLYFGPTMIALNCKCNTDFTGANTFNGVLIVEYVTTNRP
jgi:hypothetical protein